MEAIELGFDTLVRLCILLIELAGIIVIVISMVRGFIGFVQKDDGTRIQLAQGIMLGLEFKVGSEVLHFFRSIADIITSTYPTHLITRF